MSRVLFLTSAIVLSAAIVVLGFSSMREAGAVPGGGLTIYGTSANTGNFLSVNPANGAGVLVGPTGTSAASALATHPTTGVVYLGRGGGSPFLYTVNPGSGQATLVGNTGLGFAAIGGMDFAADGTLYAAVNIAGDGGTGSDHLATIDYNSSPPTATIVGPLGTCFGISVPSSGGGACDNEGMEGIAFDAAGVLWGAHSTRGSAGAPGLYTISTATGQATFVAPITDGSGGPSGGVVSLQFSCNGTLYGGSARALFPAADGGFLGTINTANGDWTFVGGVSATGNSSLGGLAHQTSCPVPSPVGGTVALMVSEPSSSGLAQSDGVAPSDAMRATLFGGIAGGALLLIAVGWFARRRWLA